MIIKKKEEFKPGTFYKWLKSLNIKTTCSVKGCTCDADAIIMDIKTGSIPMFTLCKAHFQHGIDSKEGWNYKLNLLPHITKSAKKGDKVHYVGLSGDLQNGMIKEICKDGLHAFVVYKCGDEWDNFMDYTGARTYIKNLFPGWIEKTKE